MTKKCRTICKKKHSYASFFNSMFSMYSKKLKNSNPRKQDVWLNNMIRDINTKTCNRCKSFNTEFFLKACRTQSVCQRYLNIKDVVEIDDIRKQVLFIKNRAATIIQKKVLHHQYKPNGVMMKKQICELSDQPYVCHQ